ncbi:MAG: CcmD family protein [Bacteroidota bacterium]|nr:CcmD family protein [Bacteroidota bacterium]
MEFLQNNELYIVMIVILTIWFGLLGYLFKLDSKIKQLEEQLKK